MTGPAPAAPIDSGLDETTIVARAQDGDLAAFEMLIDRYQARLFRLAVRTVKDRGMAEDVVQDSMINAWRKLPTLNDPGAFRTWIYRMVSFRCLDALRRRRDETEFDDRVDPDPGRAGADPAATVEHREQWRDLQQAVAELSTPIRLCWVLKEIDGLSYTEISEIVNQPVSTVRGRLARARKHLAERMSSWR